MTVEDCYAPMVHAYGQKNARPLTGRDRAFEISRITSRTLELVLALALEHLGSRKLRGTKELLRRLQVWRFS